jgi:hypothetical protein
MLSDPREIEIISRARQKNVRDPGRPRMHFERIFADFLAGVAFRGQHFLDLGAGQFDFGVMARERGAEVTGIDNDPAVIELGRFKGFPVLEAELRELKAVQLPRRFDGVFCKYSINAFWYWEGEGEHRAALRELMALMEPGAWAWIAPWNGAPNEASLSEALAKRALEVQVDEFMTHGFEVFELTEELSRYYGVHGMTANRALITRNLNVPERVQALCRRKPTGS